MFLPILGLCILLASCDTNSSIAAPLFTSQEICGRDEDHSAVYRAKVPNSWLRQDPSPQESIVDTKKSLCEFTISESAGSIRITIHNFPSETQSARIPPASQIARWKRQLSNLDLTRTIVHVESWGGFAGLFFEGIGQMDGHPATVLGWAMQLTPEHYTKLSIPHAHNPQLSNERYLQQMRSDYTIKAVGSPEMIDKHRQEITNFAHTFELIHDIPS